MDWEHLRDETGPIKPVVVNETDVSNFEKESKKLEEEEKQNPFIKASTMSIKNEWTSKLDLKKFQMKRRDLLHQLNLEDYEKYKNQGKEPKKEEYFAFFLSLKEYLIIFLVGRRKRSW